MKSENKFVSVARSIYPLATLIEYSEVSPSGVNSCINFVLEGTSTSRLHSIEKFLFGNQLGQFGTHLAPSRAPELNTVAADLWRGIRKRDKKSPDQFGSVDATLRNDFPRTTAKPKDAPRSEG